MSTSPTRIRAISPSGDSAASRKQRFLAVRRKNAFRGKSGSICWRKKRCFCPSIAAMCSQCSCAISVYHILSEYPNQRWIFFKTTTISLSVLLGKIPQVHLSAFLKAI
ncbi:hypothetical protein AVEN_107046-1 [Araneus ventricosus]|uniref:Uncharacterized protein n=1 Tax=Araneus ventricosus TaxID=182803 RepID=A0A4Y2WP64_ARAVE|nr:hypothetical protein AVEN_107046-1 [Araneus ventricosus]